MRILEIRTNKDSLINQKVVKCVGSFLWIQQNLIIDGLICRYDKFWGINKFLSKTIL